MKRLIFSALLSFIFLSAFCQNLILKDNDSINNLDPKKMKQGLWLEDKDGNKIRGIM